MKKIKLDWPKIEAMILKNPTIINNWTDRVKSYCDDDGYVEVSSEEDYWYTVQGYTILKIWVVDERDNSFAQSI